VVFGHTAVFLNNAAFNNFATLNGGSGVDTFQLVGGTLDGIINGGAGANSLTGDNVPNTWTITGANVGTVTGVKGGFSNIATLKGGPNSDLFHLAGGSLS